MKHPVGSTIGRYRVDGLLGVGGMGEVYKAHDTELGRSVAVKVIAGDAGPDLAARMRREARTASALSHPNAATVFDVGEVDGHPYIVMELIEGKSLRALVATDAASVRDKLRMLRQVASALEAAHERGLVHRDVKPENVMVRPDGVAKLLDFGIAKETEKAIDPSAPTEPGVSSALTKTGTSVGSPAYMSPEQIRGLPTDGRADQFAWAVTAYELLTGKLPWKSAGSTYEIAASILHEEPNLEGAFSSDVPSSVQHAIEKALSKEPEDRFPTMGAIVEAMDGDSAAPVAAVTNVAAVVAPRRPTPWSAIVVALVVAALGTVMLLALLKPVQEEKEKPKRRGPILGLNDEATKRAEAEIDDPSLAVPTTSASTSASAATSASSPLPGASADAPPPPAILPCVKPPEPACAAKNEAWCDESGKRVACCVKGLVATANGRCTCAPGGVTSDELAKSGCEHAPPEKSAPRIQAKVRAEFDKLRACYEAALQRNKKTQGNVAVTFMIGPDGAVYRAELAGSTAPDPAFQDCLVDEFKKMRFDPPPDGRLQITYPLAFSPG